MKDDGPNKRHPTIAIPRVLWWFRQWPFWKTFFEGLGCRIITNDPARPTRRRHERASTIVEEACFPIQLLIDRTLAIAEQADAIFMPRLISVVPRGIMCPRFTGVPDIVRMVLEQGRKRDVRGGRWEAGSEREEPGNERREAGSGKEEEKTGKRPTSCAFVPPPTSRLSPLTATGCQPVLLAPAIDARLGRGSVRKAYLTVAAQLGASPAQARQAFRQAIAVEDHFDAQFETRLNHLPTPEVFDIAEDTGTFLQQSKIKNLKSKIGEGPPPALHRPRVALLGHPYVTLDWEFNLAIVDKLRSFGVWVVPVEAVAHRQIEASVKKLDKNIYWSSGREVLGAALSFFEKGGVEGVIYLSCFKCGVDGLLTEVVRWAARHQSQVAYLPLTLDGHDNEMGLMTRLEAFVDIVRRRAQRPT